MRTKIQQDYWKKTEKLKIENQQVINCWLYWHNNIKKFDKIVIQTLQMFAK